MGKEELLPCTQDCEAGYILGFKAKKKKRRRRISHDSGSVILEQKNQILKHNHYHNLVHSEQYCVWIMILYLFIAMS